MGAKESCSLLLCNRYHVCYWFYGETVEAKVLEKGLEIMHSKFERKILSGSKVMNVYMHVSFSLWHTVEFINKL